MEVGMKWIAIPVGGVLGLLVLFQTAAADGPESYGGQKPWWNIFAKRTKLNPEEEKLQRFWHDYYSSMGRYYSQLDRIDWVAYYKNHGYEVNTGSPSPASGPIIAGSFPVPVGPINTGYVPLSRVPINAAFVPLSGNERPQDKTTPVPWEYKVETEAQVKKLGHGDVTAGLNALGIECWELAAIRHDLYYFKRPVPPDGHVAIPPGLVVELMDNIVRAAANLALGGFCYGDMFLFSGTDLGSPDQWAELNLTPKQKEQYVLISLQMKIKAAHVGPDPRLDSGTQYIYGMKALQQHCWQQFEAILSPVQRAALQELQRRRDEEKRAREERQSRLLPAPLCPPPMELDPPVKSEGK